MINAGGLALAIALATTCALVSAHRVPVAAVTAPAAHDIREAMAGGAWGVRGGDGVVLPVADYHRIVCLVPEADDAFAELGLATRLIGISAYSREHSRHAVALAGVPATINAGAGVEALLALHPDLVISAAFSDPGRNDRLRAAGIPVFDLGAEAGIGDAAQNVRRLAALCGEWLTGDQVAASFLRRLGHVADAHAARPRALYVAVWGRRMSGAGAGTGGHDLLEAAGCSDAAAAAGLKGWPDYTVEDLRRLDPDIIVTATGMGAAIAELPGALDVPAMRRRSIVEVDPDLLDSPGLTMLDAAEAVADGVARLAASSTATATATATAPAMTSP